MSCTKEQDTAIEAETLLLTIDELPSHLRGSPSTVRRLVKDGAQPAYRIGGRLRFKRHEVMAYVDAQRVSVERAEAGGDTPL
ncbi:MAG TPA: helix-turn-helix domain-containing protein [Roseiflexaceae bacterium]|nr:helix-turn-helix domain-containing protein [Roseiflexaceae bacterium]